ncbi:1-aminocyclopropane-1-carboxylate deaminase [Paenibacillus marchantiophytorum]|uniref:1-aminocyclopropane-1-carboxylate deaminase n=1 Tax=Paenibacillus marchantiophytorum TaxID=1619310 RepID=A0ABQ1F340_9BACL|nr:D-cysteine desulfhydrase family protein [Paenibacillus marchantiophytorum]GFZ98531.1 1-aminocyclopropane-1-carboxylate deaminase [Paenibacillus marchantiophytorum]
MTTEVNNKPRVSLGEWPTPLQEAKQLSELLGGRLLVKREDLSGLGAGGNKARKLEFHLGQALAEGATHLITTGAVQSNHAHLTAAAARKLGLQAHLVLTGSSDASPRSGNLLLDHILEAEITFVEPPEGQSAQAYVTEQMREIARRIAEAGGKAFIIPEGGTDLLGTLGYIEALRELGGQLEQRLGSASRVLVAVAAGTCGTFAGLLAGAKLSAFPFAIDVLGVSISGKTELKIKRTVRLVNEALQASGSLLEVTDDQVWIEDRFIGEGYASKTKEGAEAIRITAQNEGIFLDPVYTGKAMAALLHLGRTGELDEYDAVVFLHTGGLPLLFHYA